MAGSSWWWWSCSNSRLIHLHLLPHTAPVFSLQNGVELLTCCLPSSSLSCDWSRPGHVVWLSAGDWVAMLSINCFVVYCKQLKTLLRETCTLLSRVLWCSFSHSLRPCNIISPSRRYDNTRVILFITSIFLISSVTSPHSLPPWLIALILKGISSDIAFKCHVKI